MFEEEVLQKEYSETSVGYEFNSGCVFMLAITLLPVIILILMLLAATPEITEYGILFKY